MIPIVEQPELNIDTRLAHMREMREQLHVHRIYDMRCNMVTNVIICAVAIGAFVLFVFYFQTNFNQWNAFG